MKQYRRKPLQLIDQGLPESVADILSNVETLPTITSDSVDLPLSPEAIMEPIAEIMQPVMGETAAMPSPEALVQQAASILEGDLSTSLPSAQTVPFPLDLGSTTSSSPSSYSVPGLVEEMHGFVNELANLLSLKSDLVGNAQEPPLSSDASVPLLQPSHPSHAGETVQLSFKVHNDSTETAQAQVFCTDLYSCEEDLIPRHSISISPQSLNLAPDAMDTISISIQLPQSLPKGEYSGVLMAAELSYLKAVVCLQIN